MHENLGPLPIGPHDHPDPHTMVWTELELRAIRAYAVRCMAAERERSRILISDPTVRPQGGEIAETLAKALRRAYSLGQRYWQQADSESYAENRRAGETNSKFEALIEETRQALFAHCRDKANADARQLQHCAIAVSDWLAGGCDANDIPRPHIAALVAWTKETTREAAALGPNAKFQPPRPRGDSQ